MENPQGKSESPKQICTITLIFVVESDNAAIIVKKVIDEAARELPGSRLDFRITDMTRHGPPI